MVIYVILKAAGQEALGDHVEQPYILLPVMLRIIEESTERCYHVSE